MAQTLKFGNKTWATKVGSTLAYNDENGNYKPLPFAFTRSTSATRVNKEGLIEVVTNDRPRIDYTDTSDGVLLLENAATNLVTYSEDFSQSYWPVVGSSVVGGFSSPSADSSLGAFKLVEDTTGNRHGINHTFTGINSSTDYSFSINIKSNGRQWVYFKPFDWINSYIWFDVLNGVVGNISNHSSFTFKNGKINKMANGFFNVSFTVDTTFPQIQIGLALTTSNNVTSNYTGDGESGVYIFGAQFEIGNLSSYISTQGSATTRVAETASGSGNSEVFNDSEGVLFANIAAFEETNSFEAISINDNTTSDRVFMGYYADDLLVAIIAGGVFKYNVNTPINVKQNNKILIKYKSNDFALWLNGFEINSSSGVNGGTTPSGLYQLSFNKGDGTDDFYGKTKEIGYYNTILTDLELETLTSYKSWTSMVNELNLNIIYNG